MGSEALSEPEFNWLRDWLADWQVDGEIEKGACQMRGKHEHTDRENMFELIQ